MKHDQPVAVIYARVSDPKQASVRGDGLHSQEQACRAYADRRGLTVAEVFTDTVTGAKRDRVGFRNAMAFIKKNRGAILIVDHPNRLARDLFGHLMVRDEIEEIGGQLESPNMEFKNDSASRLKEHVVASVSEYQRSHNAEQTLSRMKSRSEQGYWTLQAPVGFRYQQVRGRGKVLVRNEPVASVVQEALEGYAFGRFETQADVMRFLQSNPLFPKDSSGIVRNQRVAVLLRQCLYAGYIEMPRWGISLRPAQHEPLISFQTYQRIQDRLNGGIYAPRKRNVNEDFPLRGFVMCADCGTPLTACWSKGRTAKHPYYLCPNKRGACPSYGKSIRREVLEGEFEQILENLTPSEPLVRVVTRMFKDLWQRRLSQTQDEVKALNAKLAKVEQDAAKLLDRILDATLPSVIAAYEKRIESFEREKLVIREKIADSGKPRLSYDQALRTAFAFLENPQKLWDSGNLDMRRTVLKLAFGSKLEYRRNEGLRTPNLTLPFKVLAQISGEKKEMARPKRFELLTPRFVV